VRCAMTTTAFIPRLLGAGLVLGLVGVGPVQAGVGPSDFDAMVPCGAFQRTGGGGWTALAPVTLRINNGTNISFSPGNSMNAGSTIAGIAVPTILDRHCGNR